MPNALGSLSHLILTKCLGIIAIIFFFFLQVRRLKLRNFKPLVQYEILVRGRKGLNRSLFFFLLMKLMLLICLIPFYQALCTSD